MIPVIFKLPPKCLSAALHLLGFYLGEQGERLFSFQVPEVSPIYGDDPVSLLHIAILNKISVHTSCYHSEITCPPWTGLDILMFQNFRMLWGVLDEWSYMEQPYRHKFLRVVDFCSFSWAFAQTSPQN